MESRTEKGTERPKTSINAVSSPAPTAARRRLHPAAVRLILVTLLFTCWMGYLIYLAATRPLMSDGVPLVLSRPQFLVSELDVIAEVNGTGPDATVVIKEILYPKSGAEVEVEQKLAVGNLGQCRLRQPVAGEKNHPPPIAPGLYLLPLQKQEKSYTVVPTPRSPGYPPPLSSAIPRVYAVNDPALKRAALAQYNAIKKP